MENLHLKDTPYECRILEEKTYSRIERLLQAKTIPEVDAQAAPNTWGLRYDFGLQLGFYGRRNYIYHLNFGPLSKNLFILKDGKEIINQDGRIAVPRIGRMAIHLATTQSNGKSPIRMSKWNGYQTGVMIVMSVGWMVLKIGSPGEMAARANYWRWRNLTASLP